MTAGTTTRTIGSNRISLPRAGLGALLAGTLLVGSLLGAAAYAGFTGATSNAAADAAADLGPLPRESVVVRNARIAAGNGPLVGDAPSLPAKTTVNRNDHGIIRFGQWLNSRHTGVSGHAPGHGPLP